VLLKVILALVAYYSYKCKQYDIITVFLNIVIDRYQIYIELLYGFEDYMIQLAGIVIIADS
jgi:hypothetical protein